MLDTIVEHKKKRQITVFRNFCGDTPSWDEFIGYMEDSSYLDANIQTGSDGHIKGNITSKEPFYYYMPSHGYLGEARKNISSALSDIFKVEGDMAGVFVTLSSNIINVRPHSDPMDTFYWQCIGSTEWIGNGESYIVNKGDLVFIPGFSQHAVNFFMPRTAITFTWDLAQSPIFNQ